MNLSQLLAELGNHMGLSNLRLNERGVCRLVFDQKLSVTIELAQDGKTLILYSLAGKVPDKAGASFLRMLLDASLFGRGTGGCISLAMESDDGEIYLQSLLPIDKLDGITLAGVLEDLVNSAENWHQRFETNDFPSFEDSPEAAGEPAAASPSPYPADTFFVRP
ncbi:hypothetical protein DB346_00325 [Verrucomicrobia bacterium LW23]|nr:hypothetical protein DB346_00325 [Verrucomicrobia bacterium LW23]